jgi:cell wall-associated NlpC family hydrolase
MQIPSNITDKVEKVLYLAEQAYQAKIPYEYGGKPRMTGLDPNWGSILTYDMNKNYYIYNQHHNHYNHGLDCSGFITWLTWTALGQKVTGRAHDMMTNSSISTPISDSQLQPGDLGFFVNSSGEAKHVGIYAGNGIWYHQGSAGTYATPTINGRTVTSKGFTKKEQNSKFSHYVRLKVLQ